VKSKLNLELFFPDPYTPTNIQKRVLSKLSAALNSNKKFIILNAPTGTGKSLIAKAIGASTPDCPTELQDILKSNHAFDIDSSGEYVNADIFNKSESHSSCILTITKALQDQYMTLFSDMTCLKGKANYTSSIDERYDVETEHAVMPRRLIQENQHEGKCPYCNSRSKSIKSRVSTLNYKMFLSLPDFAKHRNILICDEASELEEELVQRFSCKVEYKILDYLGVKYGKLKSEKESHVKVWVSCLVNNVEDRLTSICRKSPNNISKSRQSKIKNLKSLKSSLNEIDFHWYDCQYIVEKEPKGVTLTPYKVDKLSEDLFAFGDRIILQSATIINPAIFAKNLGIKDYTYIDVENMFDPGKSPIYVSTKYSLNYKNMSRVLPRVAKQIDHILEHHKGEKGIIHTHTHKITTSLKSLLSKSDNYKRLLFREQGVDNIDIIEEHTTREDPSVLVSPSLTYGVDLKDDLGRFQIIVKLPYLPLGSKRIKRLFDEDKEWYENKMLNNLVQAAGRTTRGEDDHSTTYILDGNIKNTMRVAGHKLPKHFIDRFA